MSDEDGEDSVWYPSVDDVLLLHDDIVSEDDDASSGVNDADRIEFAIDYVKHGHFVKFLKPSTKKHFT